MKKKDIKTIQEYLRNNQKTFFIVHQKMQWRLIYKKIRSKTP